LIDNDVGKSRKVLKIYFATVIFLKSLLTINGLLEKIILW